MPKKGYKQTKEHKAKRSALLKGRHINPQTEFKKGQKAWNYINGKRLKRKFKKVDGKSVLNSHFVWCNQLENLSYVPQGFVIHHLDNNSLNDNPNNLVLLPNIFHKKFHNKLVAGDKLR